MRAHKGEKREEGGSTTVRARGGGRDGERWASHLPCGGVPRRWCPIHRLPPGGEAWSSTFPRLTEPAGLLKYEARQLSQGVSGGGVLDEEASDIHIKGHQYVPPPPHVRDGHPLASEWRLTSHGSTQEATSLPGTLQPRLLRAIPCTDRIVSMQIHGCTRVGRGGSTPKWKEGWYLESPTLSLSLSQTHAVLALSHSLSRSLGVVHMRTGLLRTVHSTPSPGSFLSWIPFFVAMS